MARNIMTTTPRPRMAAPWAVRDVFRWPEWLLDDETLASDGDICVEEFQKGSDFIVRAEIPGVDPDKDITVSAADGLLTIRAERRFSEERDEAEYHRSEMRYGAFTKVLTLPAGVRADKITASYKDGILELRAPIDKAQATKIKVTHS